LTLSKADAENNPLVRVMAEGAALHAFRSLTQAEL